MGTIDMVLNYAIDLTMALGGGYIGTSFVVYMADRWKELDNKPRLKVAQEVKIPLNLKAADAVPLELEQQDLAVATMPIDPAMAPAPERQELRSEPVLLEDPELSPPPKIPQSEAGKTSDLIEAEEEYDLSPPVESQKIPLDKSELKSDTNLN
jgi:hypothetical protein